MQQSPGQPEPDPGYSLETPEIIPPKLRGHVVARASVDELIDCLAGDLVMHAENCVREFGDFQIALSGGEVFEPLYRRLMYDPNYRRLPWRRTHLWFVAEQLGRFDSDQLAFRQINETLGDHADIPPNQFHALFADSADAVGVYEQQIREALGWREKGQDRLDFVLLTIDAQGGTAGLFTGGTTDDDGTGLVCRSVGPGGEPVAVTLTRSFINAARFVAILVTGPAAAATIEQLAEAPGECGFMPVHGIEPMNGELKWYLDGPASGTVAPGGDSA